MPNQLCVYYSIKMVTYRYIDTFLYSDKCVELSGSGSLSPTMNNEGTYVSNDKKCWIATPDEGMVRISV